MRSHHVTVFLYALLLSISLSASIVQVSNEKEYNNEVLGNNKRVLVKFSADWCSVCNGVQKPFEEIADEDEFTGITFANVDVDKLDNVSKQNGIVGVPTFVYIENGTKKIEEIGVQNMPTFKNHLRENLRKTFSITQNDATSPQLVSPGQVETDAPQETLVPAPKQEEPNLFIRILNPIKNFVMMIIDKITGFFSTIVEAITGFFGK